MRRRRSSQLADAVHRLVADDLFQDHRRRRPVDPAQHQEAAVEPRREQMHEIGIDRLEVVAMIERVEQLLAHAHQRGGAARREIEPAQQFLPARLGRGVHFGGGLVGRLGLPGGDRGIEPLAVRTEAVRQRLEEGDARPGGQLGVFGEDFLAPAPRRTPRRGPTAVPRTVRPGSPSAPPPSPRRSRVRSSSARPRSVMLLQHFAEEGRVHGAGYPELASPRSYRKC